jgi:FkbM family methyltransferase
MGKKLLIAAALVVCALAGVVVANRDWKGFTFARLAWKRDQRCSLGDVWAALGENQRLWGRIGEIAEDVRLIETDPAGFELIEAEGAKFWIPRRNRLALAEMIGEQEAEVYGAAGRGVRPGDIVLDCGANVGVFTRQALEAGARLVVAIEPAPENLHCLNRNFADEIRAGRVIVHPKGVWDKDDTLTLRTFEDQSGGDSVALKFPGSRPGPTVPLTMIDKLVEELRLERVDFIKMDIEGAERRALAGARRTVERFKPRMAISMEHEPDDAAVIPALIEKQWLGRKVECGRCTWVHTALVDRVQPEEVYAAR